MLNELRIENFAIIQRLELIFSGGLTTLTGETGAGKSIILDAIEALIGGRADPTLIRSGADRAQVEAVFSLPERNRQAILDILQREELLDDPHQITLSRELRREGRSIARINGRSVSLNLLRELGSYLVDIHGQSEHLSLLNVRQHIDLLDGYADAGTKLAAYRAAYQRLHALRRELKELRQSEEESARRADFFTFQIQEIEAARLKPGEDEELRQERDRLANAESLAELVQQSLAALDESTPETMSASDLLGRVVQALSQISRLDASQAPLQAQAETLEEGISDLAASLRGYMEEVEFNPRRLEQVEERLDLLHNLKRKYGGSVESILAYAEEARRKLDRITHAAERIAELEADEAVALAELAEAALVLSARRKTAAEALGKAVEGELDDLQMAGARFMVELRTTPHADGVPLPDGSRVAFDAGGIDQVEFLIAPNPGEGFKPLVKIASGGETARLMLALKNVLVRADAIPTLIFDEIDQGIGGRAGMVVGEKLWQLGREHQVFCVTHLPQLAAFGDQQLKVRKEVADGRTTTQVEKLDEARRLDELAEMLGKLTEASRSTAQETLALARQRVKELGSR